MILNHDEKIAFFDIDGVLANDDHRIEHALDKKWPLYFDVKLMEQDTVREEGRTVLLVLQSMGWTIAYLTGRREDRRVLTQTWLDVNNFPFGALYMRPIGVKIPLANLKKNFLADLIGRGYQNVVLFDDDPEVVDLIQRDLGPNKAQHCTWYVKKKPLIKAATA